MHLRPSRSTSLGALAAISLLACADEGGPATRGQDEAGLAIAVAPLQYPSLAFACFDLAVANESGATVDALGDPERSFLEGDRATICSDRYGNGPGGDVGLTVPCDASNDPNDDGRATHTVTLWIDGLYSPDGDGYVDTGDYRNPCAFGCSLAADCRANADVPVAFNITMLRRAEQGFFDLAVRFDDVYCSAKADSCVAATGAPIEQLYNESGLSEVRTAVFAHACTASPRLGGPTTPTDPSPNPTTDLHVSKVTVACERFDGEAWGAFATYELDLTKGPGNVRDLAPREGADLDEDDDTSETLDYAVYPGHEELDCGSANGNPLSCNKTYLNWVIDLEDLTLLGVRRSDGQRLYQTRCSTSYELTASNGRDGKLDNGHLAGPGRVQPVIRVGPIALTVGGEAPCFAHPLDGTEAFTNAPSAVRTAYVSSPDLLGGDAMLPMCFLHDREVPLTDPGFTDPVEYAYDALFIDEWATPETARRAGTMPTAGQKVAVPFEHIGQDLKAICGEGYGASGTKGNLGEHVAFDLAAWQSEWRLVVDPVRSVTFEGKPFALSFGEGNGVNCAQPQTPGSERARLCAALTSTTMRYGWASAPTANSGTLWDVLSLINGGFVGLSQDGTPSGFMIGVLAAAPFSQGDLSFTLVLSVSSDPK